MARRDLDSELYFLTDLDKADFREFHTSEGNFIIPYFIPQRKLDLVDFVFSEGSYKVYLQSD